MVKHILFLLVISSICCAKQNVYEQNCLSCHKELAVKIDKFFYRYLLKYSSEAEVKKAMMAYLKNPKKDTSILQDGLIQRFGVKKKTTLTDEKLKESIDIYWETYTVFGRLK
ncbi:MAG: hypothetical protein EOL93_06120 [Epsilonproteobacteria bacterium]|jgi:hypothetical protein|nr:hypothetical protein [Campylobacterota bacterium]